MSSPGLGLGLARAADTVRVTNTGVVGEGCKLGVGVPTAPPGAM
jgi:hypothetical protein